MYEMAKKAREAMKSKARRLAGEKDIKTDSSTWSPAPLLRSDVKTGARPIMKPSAKGIGESNAARDTKAAIGDAKRGAFKSGGAVKDAGVKDKKALGAIDPSPKRGAAQNYKRGGKAEGGKLPSPYEAMRSEERMGRVKVEEKNKMPSPKEAAESAARVGDVPEGRKSGGKKWIAGAIKHPGALRKSLGVKEGEKIPAKKLSKAAEAPGKLGQRARLAQTLKKLGKKRGGGVGLTVVIADKGGRAAPQGMTAPIAPRAVPVPQAAAPMPMPAAPPPAQMPPVPMRKSGGRITKVASSYKDMQAGAANGEGRLQKTDIAKKRKGAPTA